MLSTNVSTIEVSNEKATACLENVMICDGAGTTASTLWLIPILVTYGNS